MATFINQPTTSSFSGPPQTPPVPLVAGVGTLPYPLPVSLVPGVPGIPGVPGALLMPNALPQTFPQHPPQMVIYFIIFQKWYIVTKIGLTYPEKKML